MCWLRETPLLSKTSTPSFKAVPYEPYLLRRQLTGVLGRLRGTPCTYSLVGNYLKVLTEEVQHA